MFDRDRTIDPFSSNFLSLQMGNCLDYMSDYDQRLEQKLSANIKAFIFHNVKALDYVEDIIRIGNDVSQSVCSTDLAHMALEQIAKYMQANTENMQVQQRACLGICRIAQIPCLKTQKKDNIRVVRAVIQAMNNPNSPCELQQHAIMSLHALADHRPTLNKIVSLQGVQCVSSAMKLFEENASVQTDGTKTLNKLSQKCIETKRQVGQIGAIETIINAMDKHEGTEQMQVSGCSALRNLTDRVQVNQWLAAKSYAIEAISKAMEAFPYNWNIRFDGFIAIGNMCRNDEENSTRAVGVGLVEPFIRFLCNCLHDELFQHHGLLLVRNWSRIGDQVREEIGRNEGLETILASLETHRNNMKILEHGCAAMRYLLFLKENRIRLLRHNGLEPLVSALRNGSESAIVSEKVVQALGNAVFDIFESKKEVAKLGGIAAITKVMAKYLDNVPIQEIGCRTLRNLADADMLNIMILSASGAVDAGIFAMISYPDNVHIQQQGCELLWNMSACEESNGRMKGLDVVRVLTNSLERHCENVALQDQIVALLKQLHACREKKKGYVDFTKPQPNNSCLDREPSRKDECNKTSFYTLDFSIHADAERQSLLGTNKHTA